MTTAPVAEIAIGQPISCADSMALLTIGGSSTGPQYGYLWTGPDFASTGTFIEPSQPGIYVLEITNALTGCAASDSVLLTLPEPPTGFTADVLATVCPGTATGSISITDAEGGTPPYTYQLDDGNPQASPDFGQLLAGTYVVTVIDDLGCTFADTITVDEGMGVTIELGLDIELEYGDSTQLFPEINIPWSQVDSIVWMPADVLSCTRCPNPFVYGLHNAVVRATIYAGGCVDQDALVLRAELEPEIYIPNVFSPNGDNINDHVTVFTDDKVRRVVYLEIFDRWGNLVFIGRDFPPNIPPLGWDGTFKGKPMNPAVFAYIAQVELINGQTLERKGDITLLR
jgi:gliding motility-associated-like protein